MKTLKILVTGGGSSGHISPALAIIQTLRDLAAKPGCDWGLKLLYVGGRHGLEQKLVEAQNVPFVGVETGKLRRYFSKQNFTDALRVPIGVQQSLAEVRRFAPDVVVATGGYVAVPPVVAARMLGIPILIHEQTVQIGLANRIAARCATRIALSWESALEELPASLRARAWVTGNPIRPVVFGGDRTEAERFAGFDSQSARLPTLYVTGGSQGARIINRAVESALPELLQHCRIIHQCGRQPEGGEQDFDRLQSAAAKLSPELRGRYFTTQFISEEIKHVFALADLVVGRAGAGTVSELCALGKPALYIPLVPTGGDEQTRNAHMCVERGAAAVITQAEFNGERLLQSVKELLSDKAKLVAMGQAALILSSPNAALDLAEAVIELAQQ